MKNEIDLSSELLKENESLKSQNSSLRDINRRYHSLIQNTNMAIITLDSTGNTISWNMGAEKMFGYMGEEIIGRPILIIFLKSIYVKYIRKLLINKGLENIEIIDKTISTEGITRNGKSFPIQLSLSRWSSNDEIFIGVIIRDITDQVDAEIKIKSKNKQLSLLNEITNSLNNFSSTDLIESILTNSMKQIVELTQADGIECHLVNDEGVLVPSANWGLNLNFVTGSTLIKFNKNKGVLGSTEQNNTITYLEKIEDETMYLRKDLAKRNKYQTLICVPISERGIILGTFTLYSKSPRKFHKINRELLLTVGGALAMAIDRKTLIDELQNTNEDISTAYDATIEGWARALEIRDMETEGHSRRVSALSVKLAKKLKVDESLLPDIYKGALLHDIGKMGITDIILQKPGKLNDEEWEILKLHPVHAYNWLSPIKYLDKAIDIPHYHHEKWDGSGYPEGLEGEAIPYIARIFAIVDVYDALTSDRPYRNAWPEQNVLEYLKSQVGIHFDPHIAKAFLELKNYSSI